MPSFQLRTVGIPTAFPVNLMLDWLNIFHRLLSVIHFQVTCLAAILTVTCPMVKAVTYDLTHEPGAERFNVSEAIHRPTDTPRQIPDRNSSTYPTTRLSSTGGSRVAHHFAAPSVDYEAPPDSPTPLIIASSIAAVTILIFFVIAYLWHTHQLDSRARKLAIRLAADAEPGLRCRSGTSPSASRQGRAAGSTKVTGLSGSSQEHSRQVAPTADVNRGYPGMSSVRLAESESADSDQPAALVTAPTEEEQEEDGSRSGRGAYRKWNRSRRSMSAAHFEKRNSAITDKEILTHFASRRHSTFFI